MFSRFWRPYVPGFRVRPHDDVPGFNIDQNGLPRRAGGWSNGMLPDAMTQRYPDAAQIEMPYSMAVPTPGSEGMVQSPPSIGLAGFRVSPQGYVPGFNVRLGDGVSGFDLKDDVQQQETIWSAPTPSPDVEEPVQPASPQFPEWVYKLITMLPQVLAASGPLAGRRVAVNPPPSLPATGPLVVKQWPSSEMPQRSEDMNIDSRGATTQNTWPQPVDQTAMSRAWPRPRNDGWSYTQPARLHDPGHAEIIEQPKGLPSMGAEPVAGYNFILARGRAADEQASRPRLPEYQQQLSAPVGTATADANPRLKSDMRTTAHEHEPERMLSPFIGINRPRLEVEGSLGDSRPIGQANGQIEMRQVASRVDLFRRDAAGLPIGAILSSIRSPDPIGDASVGAISPDDVNVHLVGDGNSLEDVPRNERHQRGVDASIADHAAKGFELVARGPLAIDVPGFSSPRLYDYIIRDPVTGLCYGVEVKTTIMSTIRLDRQQVMKDAAVVANGAKVRVLNNVELYGVSYSVYCFGCEAFDVRSAVLLSILQDAGVAVIPGILPGDIRP